MTNTRPFEDFLGYHAFKEWKKITTDVSPVIVEDFLANQNFHELATLLDEKPEEVRSAIRGDEKQLFDEQKSKDRFFAKEQKRILEKGLNYHEFKVWKQIKLGIPETVVADFLSNQDIKSIAQLISEEPDKVAKKLTSYYSKTDAGTSPKPSQPISHETSSSVSAGFVALGRMLLTPIKLKAKNIFTERMKSEITEYINLLKNADDDEVGLALVAAIDFRNNFLHNTGVDLLEPAVALVQMENITMKFSDLHSFMEREYMEEA